MRRWKDRSSNEIWITLVGIALLSLLIGVLPGCSAFVQPESFSQRLAYGYGVQTAVLNTASTQVEQGALEPAQAERVLELADRSRALLDAALLVHSLGDAIEADRQLQLAVVILSELQAYLNERADP